MATSINSTTVPWPEGLASEQMREKINSAKILAVGAGGIGCELLKTLVMTGFRNIEVIDLDTIDVSNLNRQFLFRKKHVGQSKSTVAAEAVKRFRPDLNIIAHHGNIKDPQFGVDFFRRFDLVLNGLDNLDARRHVNLMCISAGVPLVESGTAGYLGQVSVHVAGKTECFDCQPKPTPKSFPVCTIRTFPEKPIHCIVWAKELLFPCLFGEADGESDIDADGGLRKKDDESAKDYAERVFVEVFNKKVVKILEDTAAKKEEDVWQGRKPPQPLDLEALRKDSSAVVVDAEAEAHGSACAALGLTNPNATWTSGQSVAVLLESVRQMVEDRSSEIGSLSFDKDDDLAMEFVAAAANLRSLCYNIPPQSLFDSKGMAGNIIHAIATTNAIISGFIVVEALKLLASNGDPEKCKSTYLRQDISSKKLITPTTVEPPSKGCMACGVARLELRLDFSAFKFADVVSKIFRGQLGLSEFTVFKGNSIIYEENEYLEDDEIEMYAAHLPKSLPELPGGGVHDSSFITIRDEANGSTDITVIVCHKENWDEEKYPHKFAVIGEMPPPKAADDAAAEQETAAAEPDEQPGAAVVVGQKLLVKEAYDGSFTILDSEDEGAAVGGGAGKRKRGADDENGEGGKRVKQQEGDDDVIEILD